MRLRQTWSKFDVDGNDGEKFAEDGRAARAGAGI